jgi:hypothetical protein
MKDKTHSGSVPAYPLVTFQNALEAARAVSEAGGAKSDVQKSVIASYLKVSDSSGAFIQRLATARAYNMIEGRGSYRLTPDAERYFFPGDENDQRRALLSFFGAPPVFEEIIKRFDGNKVPQPDMLANILHREMKVGESWKDRVAAFFIKAADMVEVVDANGFLRYRSSLHTIGSSPQMRSTASEIQAPPQSIPFPDSDVSQKIPQKGVNAWVFSLKGQTVRVETSDELSLKLWEKLDSYIKVLKPSEEDSE